MLIEQSAYEEREERKEAGGSKGETEKQWEGREKEEGCIQSLLLLFSLLGRSDSLGPHGL